MSESAAKVPLTANKRFLSGIMFLIIGAASIYIAQDYPMGSALRMGPGYFPIVLGGIIIGFGIWELIIGSIKPDPVQGNWSIRALIILPLSAVVFGVMMETVGFVPALITLMLVAALSSTEFKFVEQLVLAICITIGAVGLFIYGLGLPYPLFAGH